MKGVVAVDLSSAVELRRWITLWYVNGADPVPKDLLKEWVTAELVVQPDRLWKYRQRHRPDLKSVRLPKTSVNSTEIYPQDPTYTRYRGGN